MKPRSLPPLQEPSKPFSHFPVGETDPLIGCVTHSESVEEDTGLEPVTSDSHSSSTTSRAHFLTHRELGTKGSEWENAGQRRFKKKNPIHNEVTCPESLILQTLLTGILPASG